MKYPDGPHLEAGESTGSICGGTETARASWKIELDRPPKLEAQMGKSVNCIKEAYPELGAVH